MERYIQRNWFRQLKDQAEAPKDAQALETSVNTDFDTRPHRLIQMYAGFFGGVLALVGLMALLADVLGPSEGTMKFLSLLPIILGGAVYGYHKTKKPDNKALRELSSTFLFITFTLSTFLAIPAFQIDLDLEQYRYVLYLCMAVGLALTYMNKSSLTAVTFLYFLLTWAYLGVLLGNIIGGFGGPLRMLGGSVGFLGSGEETVIVFWIFFAGIVKYLLDNAVEGSNLKTVILGWLVGTVALLGAGMMTGGHALLGISAMIFALYVFGKKYYPNGTAFWNRPFQTLAVIGAIYLFLIFSHDSALVGALFAAGVLGEMNTPQILGLLISLIIAGGSLFYYFKNHWQTGNKLNQFIALIPLLAILTTLLGFAKDPDLISFIAVIYTAGGIVLFGYWIKEGINSTYPPITLLGVMSIISLLIGKVSGMVEEGPATVGLYLLLVGAGLLYLVLIIDKRWNLGSFDGILPEKSSAPGVIDSPGAASQPAASSAPSSPSSDATDTWAQNTNDSSTGQPEKPANDAETSSGNEEPETPQP